MAMTHASTRTEKGPMDMPSKCFMVDVTGKDLGEYWDTPGAIFPIQTSDNETMLALVLPDGNIWNVYGKASNGPPWEITGDPPNLTARPSIMSPTYHGWLTDGILSDDLDGRTFGGAS